MAPAFVLLILLTVLLAVTGCATLDVVPRERLNEQRLTPGAVPVGHIYAANWGWYLFKHIPIITGSLDRPGIPKWPALFSDQVRVDRLSGLEIAPTTWPGPCSSG